VQQVKKTRKKELKREMEGRRRRMIKIRGVVVSLSTLCPPCTTTSPNATVICVFLFSKQQRRSL
jgi:hypothetical protein